MKAYRWHGLPSYISFSCYESNLNFNYAQAKSSSTDSCQNGTSADHHHKTNNVGSGTRLEPTRHLTQTPSPTPHPHCATSRTEIYSPSLLRSIDTCQSKASADYRYLTVSRAHFSTR